MIFRYADGPVSGPASRTVQFIAVMRGSRLLVPLTLVAVLCGPVSAQTTDRGPSLGDVFQEVPRDLWTFLSWDTAIVLGIGGGAALAAHPWDDDLAGELETNVRLNDAMEPGHTYGAFSAQALIGVGLYTGGRLAGKGRLARTGADIMRAQLLSQAYVHIAAQRTVTLHARRYDIAMIPAGGDGYASVTFTLRTR